MTRDSLKEYFMQISEAPEPSNRWQPELVCEMVDVIYDDFESRTCESCKLEDECILSSKNCSRPYKFGCSEWESK